MSASPPALRRTLLNNITATTRTTTTARALSQRTTIRTFAAQTQAHALVSSYPRVSSPTTHNFPTKRHFTSTKMGKQGVHNLSSKAEFDEALGEKGSLMVLDCFATWCGPCKVIAPKVVQFSDTYPDARFYKLDVDELPEVAQELAVRAMPTFLLFKDGEKVGEVVGANPVALEAAIKSHA